MSEIVIGHISYIMKFKGPKGLKVTKVKVELSDGRETMIPKRFFAAAKLNIQNFSKGDTLEIKKIGFDDELDQTTWEIISAKRNMV